MSVSQESVISSQPTWLIIHRAFLEAAPVDYTTAAYNQIQQAQLTAAIHSADSLVGQQDDPRNPSDEWIEIHEEAYTLAGYGSKVGYIVAQNVMLLEDINRLETFTNLNLKDTEH